MQIYQHILQTERFGLPRYWSNGVKPEPQQSRPRVVHLSKPLVLWVANLPICSTKSHCSSPSQPTCVSTQDTVDWCGLTSSQRTQVFLIHQQPPQLPFQIGQRSMLQDEMIEQIRQPNDSTDPCYNNGIRADKFRYIDGRPQLNDLQDIFGVMAD